MTLRFGLTATLVLAGGMTLLAQGHEKTHPQGPPHGPHDPIDPQVHAAMHSLVGTWTGTLGSANGPETMHLVAANDSDGHLTLRLTSGSEHFWSCKRCRSERQCCSVEAGVGGCIVSRQRVCRGAERAVAGDAERSADPCRHQGSVLPGEAEEVSKPGASWAVACL
jgi:hypothetical protein